MIATLLGAIAILMLIAQLTTIALYWRRLSARPILPRTIGSPAITLLRPVCGLDAFDPETLGSSFLQDYPEYEVIFCAPTAHDPAVPLVRDLIAAHPERPARFLIGQVNHTGNPKLNNLWNGWAAAQHDYICMTDSNLLLPPDYLSTLAASWGPDTGLVSCPAIGDRPANFAGSLECAFLNSNQARFQFAADSLGNGFAQGKTLFWHRPLLDGAGGLPLLGRYLAEDVSATKLIRSLGKRVSLPPLPYAQPIGWRSLRQIWDRQLRWSRIRRDGFPLIFATECANGAVLATLIAGAALATAGAPMTGIFLYIMLWYGAEIALMRRANWPHGGRDIAALPLRDALIPAIWLATFLRRGFEWRGTAMTAEDTA